MLEAIKKKIIPGVILAFVGSIISFGFTWFSDYYHQPRIIIDTTGNYSTFEGNKIGHITVVNVGSSTDEDITINVYSKINKGDIKTDGASLGNTVNISEDEAKFVINKLNPNDTAIITFSSSDKESTFPIGYNSRNNKIEEAIYPSQLWEFNKSQLLFITSLSLFTLLTGIYIGKPIERVKSRR